MEGAARQGDQAGLDQGLPAVDQPADLGAVLLGASGQRLHVVLVVLTEVGAVGAGHGAVVAHPRHGDGGVETTGEGDADSVTDGESCQYLGHGRQR